MIDPNNITNFGASTKQLEEQLLFWICVAGKKASTMSKCMVRLEKRLGKPNLYATPFQVIRAYVQKNGINRLSALMKECGIGCYNLKTRAFIDLVSRNLDLKMCSVEDLEKVVGIGPKTARCFIMHTRENAQVAGLDTHVLKFLRALGYDAPQQTPTGKKYKEMERIFLETCDRNSRSPAALDLLVWRVYSSHPHLKDKLLRACAKAPETPFRKLLKKKSTLLTTKFFSK